MRAYMTARMTAVRIPRGVRGVDSAPDIRTCGKILEILARACGARGARAGLYLLYMLYTVSKGRAGSSYTVRNLLKRVLQHYSCGICAQSCSGGAPTTFSRKKL